MNLPNKLTISRIFLTVFFIIFIRQEMLFSVVLATVFFILAAITDYYDGYIARKYSIETDLGRLLDPIADKILILSAFLVFLRMGIVEDWMVIIILGREVFVTGLRFFALRKKIVLSAGPAGKHKTVSQIVTIFIILGFIIFRKSLMTFSHWSPEVEVLWRFGINISMIISVGLSLISGIGYVWGNRKIIQTQ